VRLFLVIVLQQTLWNGFNLGVFGGLHGKVFLRVDFRFLLIEWVLGTELLSKGSPRGTPAIPKVSLWFVERIGRSIGWKVEFFVWAEFFPTVQAKPAWLVLKVHLGPWVDFGKLNDKAIKGLMYLSKFVSRSYLIINGQSLEYLLMNEYYMAHIGEDNGWSLCTLVNVKQQVDLYFGDNLWR
jgi:hypothetical protein